MKKLLFLLALFLLPACGDTIVDDPDWPEYKEQLVVNAEVRIIKNEVHAFCYVSKTYLLNQTVPRYDDGIRGADVRLQAGDSSHALIDGIINPMWSVRNKKYVVWFPKGEAKDFLLSVRSGSKYVQGLIQLPIFASVFDSVYRRSDPADSAYSLLVFRQHVLRNLDYVWSIRIDDTVAHNQKYYTFDLFWSHQDTPSDSKIVERTVRYKKEPNLKLAYNLSIFSREFDPNYSGGQGDDGIFGGGGRNPKFNIYGDGFGCITYSFYGDVISFPLR